MSIKSLVRGRDIAVVCYYQACCERMFDEEYKQSRRYSLRSFIIDLPTTFSAPNTIHMKSSHTHSMWRVLLLLLVLSDALNGYNTSRRQKWEQND